MPGMLDMRGAGRIVALLQSLAVLAERSAARSFPVRWLVLVLLRRAEAVAMAFVHEASGIDLSRPNDPEAGCEPADAVLLAMRLRALAAVLAALLPEPSVDDPRRADDHAGPLGGSPASGRMPAPFGAARAAFDTS